VEQRLREILVDEGRRDLVIDYQRGQMARWKDAFSADAFNKLDNLDRRLLGFIRNLEKPNGLTQRQARRLDELCDFITTVHMPDAPAASLAGSVDEAPERVEAFLSGVAPSTGLDLGVLPAEADVMLDLLEGPDERQAASILWDGGGDKGLTRWDRISAPRHLRRLLHETLSWYEWPAFPAALALGAAPQRDEALAELDELLDDFRPWSRLLASKVMMALEGPKPDRAIAWLGESDPVRRRAAAEHLVKILPSNPAARAAVERAIADPDEGVREEALDELDVEVLDARLLDQVRSETTKGSTEWYCVWCGTTNHAEARGCVTCRTSGPDSNRAARRLLQTAGFETTESPNQFSRQAFVLELDD